MKQVSTATTEAWASGDYVGPTRAVQRATIQLPHMYPTPYKLSTAATTTWDHHGVFRTFSLNQDGPIREFPVQTIKWTRSLDQDVATCTITITNASWNSKQASEMGWYTPTHDTDAIATWGQSPSPWKDWFLPDRLVRTYEGYGSDGNADPALDAMLYCSGTWIIDSIDFTAAGDMTLNMRDLGALLLEQYAFPPVVPEAVYPLHFENKSTTPAGPVVTTSSGWFAPTWSSDSNQVYAAAGTYHDGPDPACTSTGFVHGYGRQTMTTGLWASVGSVQPDWSYWEGTPNAGSLAIGSVQMKMQKGPGTIYVSVMDNTGSWYGTKHIPYVKNRDAINLSANVPYVASQAVSGTGGTVTIQLPQSYSGFEKLRVTFLSKYKTKIGKQRLYKAVVGSLKYNASNTVTSGGAGTVPTGNITDWSHVVRWVAAWAGFHWPATAHVTSIDGTVSTPGPSDPILPSGSVWGDVYDCGAAPLTRLLQNNFDQRPLADAINFARETTGFNFFVDEWGGLIWRLPNNFTAGNFVAPANGGRYGRTSAEPVVIFDDQVLIDLTATISSADVREQYFVADLQAKFGAVVAGYNPSPTGINRIAGWTDYEFASSDEALRTADLMAIRSLFKYRQDTLTIAANPSIQIDDQVIIFERTTGESYRHRVVAIECDWDADSGKWTYQLTTEWLGSQSFDSLPWDVGNLSAPTYAYLQALGAVA